MRGVDIGWVVGGGKWIMCGHGGVIVVVEGQKGRNDDGLCVGFIILMRKYKL